MENTAKKLTVKELPDNFITAYFLAGYPDREKSIEIMERAVKNGVNAIEVGFPSKNPYLDGKIIKNAHLSSENAFSSITDFIDYLKILRSKISVPIWMMGYKDDLLKENAYVKIARSSYVDGFVIPDLTISELTEIQNNHLLQPVEFIPVINYQMSDDDLRTVCDGKKIIYCQLQVGKTGNTFTDLEDLPHFYHKIRNLTDAKLMAGFGIKNGQIAKRIFEVGYDGIVVGSEMVRLVSLEEYEALDDLISELVKSKVK
mgnify:CR=1 FL=1